MAFGFFELCIERCQHFHDPRVVRMNRHCVGPSAAADVTHHDAVKQLIRLSLSYDPGLDHPVILLDSQRQDLSIVVGEFFQLCDGHKVSADLVALILSIYFFAALRRLSSASMNSSSSPRSSTFSTWLVSTPVR